MGRPADGTADEDPLPAASEDSLDNMSDVDLFTAGEVLVWAPSMSHWRLASAAGLVSSEQ